MAKVPRCLIVGKGVIVSRRQKNKKLAGVRWEVGVVKRVVS
jgi:hypothetical protein